MRFHPNVLCNTNATKTQTHRGRDAWHTHNNNANDSKMMMEISKLCTLNRKQKGMKMYYAVDGHRKHSIFAVSYPNVSYVALDVVDVFI